MRGPRGLSLGVLFIRHCCALGSFEPSCQGPLDLSHWTHCMRPNGAKRVCFLPAPCTPARALSCRQDLDELRPTQKSKSIFRRNKAKVGAETTKAVPVVRAAHVWLGWVKVGTSERRALNVSLNSCSLLKRSSTCHILDPQSPGAQPARNEEKDQEAGSSWRGEAEAWEKEGKWEG